MNCRTLRGRCLGIDVGHSGRRIVAAPNDINVDIDQLFLPADEPPALESARCRERAPEIVEAADV